MYLMQPLLRFVQLSLFSILLLSKKFMDEYSATEVLQAISEAVMVVDSNGFIEFINHNCEELFGYENQECLLVCVDELIPNFVRDHLKLFSCLQNRCNKMEINSYTTSQGLDKNGDSFSLTISAGKLEKDQHRALLLTLREDLSEYSNHLSAELTSNQAGVDGAG